MIILELLKEGVTVYEKEKFNQSSIFASKPDH